MLIRFVKNYYAQHVFGMVKRRTFTQDFY